MHQKGCFDGNIMCGDCQHWKIDYMPGGFLGKLYHEMTEQKPDETEEILDSGRLQKYCGCWMADEREE